MGARSLDTIAALASFDERERTDSFFVEGDRFVIAALTTRATVVELVVAKERRLSPTLAKLVARFHGPIRRPSMAAFESVSMSAEPSGVGAVVRRLDGELPRTKKQRGPLLCFDGVRSLGNLGSAIRSAAAFDAGAVVFLDRRVDPFDPAVVRASMGAIFMLPIVRTDQRRLASWKQRAGARIVGTSARAHRDIRRVRVSNSGVLMIGCERGGMSARQRALCDETARIPMTGRVDSLNLATATSVILYETWWRGR